MTREEALAKLEEEWPQEKRYWEHCIKEGMDPTEILSLLESFA